LALKRFPLELNRKESWEESGNAEPKPRGGSTSPLEEFASQILALVEEQPDLTLKDTVAQLR
jgi:hypothetical protein